MIPIVLIFLQKLERSEFFLINSIGSALYSDSQNKTKTLNEKNTNKHTSMMNIDIKIFSKIITL